MEEIFIYGINSIKGNVGNKIRSELINKLILLKSIIDIDKYIEKQMDSSLGILKMKLVLEFKYALENELPLKERSNSYNDFLDFLTQKGKTVEDFIQFKNDSSTLIIAMLLSLQKPFFIDEIQSMCSILKTAEHLYEDFDNWVIKELNKEISGDNEDEEFLKSVQKDILFYARSIKSEEFNIQSVESIKFLFQFHDLVDSITNILKKKMIIKNLCPYFDRFVFNKRGQLFYEKKLKDKIIEIFLQKEDENENSSECLYFKGPNVLKSIGHPIPLNGKDSSHISQEEGSIMNFKAIGGAELRQWDSLTTAIMLDLGYNIDNYWTRLWKTKNGTEYQFEKDFCEALLY